MCQYAVKQKTIITIICCYMKRVILCTIFLSAILRYSKLLFMETSEITYRVSNT
jgi:hypothetical protein